MSNDSESALGRWSRRKTEARRDKALPAAAPAEVDTTPVDSTPEPDEQAVSVEAAPALPDVADLSADSDYTPFLADGVPAALTRAALRKLWLSDPVFANLDGLNDYDEDFNVIDKVISLVDAKPKISRGMADDDPEVAPDSTETPVAEAVEEDEAAEAAKELATAPDIDDEIVGDESAPDDADDQDHDKA